MVLALRACVVRSKNESKKDKITLSGAFQSILSYDNKHLLSSSLHTAVTWSASSLQGDSTLLLPWALQPLCVPRLRCWSGSSIAGGKTKTTLTHPSASLMVAVG